MTALSFDRILSWLEHRALMREARAKRLPYTHIELITDEAAARTSSEAIREVVRAVRFGAPL